MGRMLECRKVAITGGVSSGKSSVCRAFADLGAFTVDADAIVHQLLSPNTDIGQQVIQLLGADIVVGDRLDRSKVAEKVFVSSSLLKSLERILHPAVRSRISEQYERIRHLGKYLLFVVEVPLLYESGIQHDYDVVVAVTADEALCHERFRAKMGAAAADFSQRVARQLPQHVKAQRADYVIANNGDLQTLQHAVRQLYARLTGGE